MRKILKFSILIIGIFIITSSIFYFYKYYEYKQNLNSKELNILISEINNSKKLPQNFYITYEKLNPNSTKNGIVKSAFKETQCQSYRVSTRIYPIVIEPKNNRINFLFFQYFLTKEIENKTSQIQCLNWILNKSDFLNGIKGIENASEFYYKKELFQLNEMEMENLIKMTYNPVKYNPLRKKNFR